MTSITDLPPTARPDDRPHSPSPSPPSPAPSSPRLPLASTVSTMWSGLMRTFSSDSTNFTTSAAAHNGTNPSSAATSMFDLPPLDPVSLRGYKEGTPRHSRLLGGALAEEIRTLIPERMKLVDDWDLIFSLAQDGASLGTMYSRARGYKGTRAGFVMVVQDSSGGIFGAYLSEYPHPAPSYFGNGECFLWRATTIHDLPTTSSLPPPPSADTTDLRSRSTTLALDPSSSSSSSSASGKQDHPTRLRFKAFPYSGMNDYFLNCEASFFSVGAGGGHYGLWVDSSLLRGHSSRCETFGNEPLSDKGESFSVINVELWAIGK